jgi:hypothetical protein
MPAELDAKFLQHYRGFSFRWVSRDTDVSNPPRSATESLSLSIVRSNCQITRASGVFRMSAVAEKANFLKVMRNSRPKSPSANLARPFESEATVQVH